MELHPGVFVSNVMTDEWRPDPEVGGEMHVLVEDETAYVGYVPVHRAMQSCGHGPFRNGRRS